MGKSIRECFSRRFFLAIILAFGGTFFYGRACLDANISPWKESVPNPNGANDECEYYFSKACEIVKVEKWNGNKWVPASNYSLQGQGTSNPSVVFDNPQPKGTKIRVKVDYSGTTEPHLRRTTWKIHPQDPK